MLTKSRRRSKPLAPRTAPVFCTSVLEGLARDLQSGRIPLDRITVSDEVVGGLRAIVRRTGHISFHVNYAIGRSRPYLKVGEHPKTSIDEARQIAHTVLALAAQGIDPQAGLHERLVRELKMQGAKWRP